MADAFAQLKQTQLATALVALILLVDDEVPFVETMSKRLVKRELEVIPAYDGPAALARIEENPRVEVVILNVKMPGMDGIETLSEIKKRPPSSGSSC